MKRIVLVGLTCLIAVAFSGCAHFSSLRQDTWQKYDNDRLGFSIEYPKDWVVAIEDEYGVVLSNIPRNQWNHGLGVAGIRGGMWVDVVSASTKFNCHVQYDYVQQDYLPLFDDGDLGKPVDSNVFIKNVCKDGSRLSFGFTPASANSTEKKILDSI